MLQAPGDDAGRNASFSSESSNRSVAEITVRAKSLIVTRRNEQFLRKGIRFSFARISSRRRPFALLNKDGALAVLQNMSAFVIEREPQMVISLASQA